MGGRWVSRCDGDLYDAKVSTEAPASCTIRGKELLGKLWSGHGRSGGEVSRRGGGARYPLWVVKVALTSLLRWSLLTRSPAEADDEDPRTSL